MDLVVYARIFISRPDGLTWEDLTGYLTYVRASLGQTANVGTGNSGVDDACRILEFKLVNESCFDAAWDDDINRDENALVGYDEDPIGKTDDPATTFIKMLFDVEHELRSRGASFHPRNRYSDWNYFDIDGDGIDEYAPLLWPQREVIFEVAVVSAGTEPTEDDWVNQFHGIMGDSISADTETGEITVLCRDKMKRLMDAYIENPKEYGSEEGTAAEVVMQQIIDDNISHNPPQLVCPVSPGFMITPYKVEYMTVADALMQIANQIGWWLGYARNPVTNAWELTLLEPPRDKDSSTADYEIDWNEDIIIQDLDISDQDVRNRVTIIYRDADTGERASVTVKDEDSIKEFGLRAMQIEESETSLIDTEIEATAYGEAALHDLKDLNAVSTIELPLMPELDIFNGLVVNNPVLSSTKDFFGVETVEHELDFTNFRFRTHATCSGRVIGAHTRWLLMETRPGSPGKPGTLPPTQIGPSKPANVQATFTGINVLVSWDKPTEPDYKHTRVEIWTGAVPEMRRTEFTDTSYYVYTYEKNAEDHNGEPVPEVFVRVIHVDMFGNFSRMVEKYTVNMPPPQPSGFTMGSKTSIIQMSIDEPNVADLDRIEFQLSSMSNYADAITVAKGTNYTGISSPIMTPKTNYGRARFVDVFGQTGPWATGSTGAELIAKKDIDHSALLSFMDHFYNDKLMPVWDIFCEEDIDSGWGTDIVGDDHVRSVTVFDTVEKSNVIWKCSQKLNPKEYILHLQWKARVRTHYPTTGEAKAYRMGLWMPFGMVITFQYPHAWVLPGTNEGTIKFSTVRSSMPSVEPTITDNIECDVDAWNEYEIVVDYNKPVAESHCSLYLNNVLVAVHSFPADSYEVNMPDNVVCPYFILNQTSPSTKRSIWLDYVFFWTEEKPTML